MFHSLLGLLLAGAGSIPSVSGMYYSMAGYESLGGQLRMMDKTDLDTLMAACARDSACVGFNTYGSLKKTLQPRSQWRANSDPDFMVYIKNTKRIPPDYVDNNYEVYKGWAIIGHDMHRFGRDSEDARRGCSGRKKCRAFGTDGYLKEHVPSQREWEYQGENVITTYYKGHYRPKSVRRHRHHHRGK